jgi:hypothetical protein
MPNLPLSFALKELSSRNTQITATYREWARRLLPGPITKLTVSIAEQRLDLGKALKEIASYKSLPEVEVEFDLAPAAAAGVSSSKVSLEEEEPRFVLRKIADAEMADHELLAAVAGAVLPASGPVAERLAAEASSARKRSIWAQDQLELLDL